MVSRETETHLGARDGCHVSTVSDWGVTLSARLAAQLVKGVCVNTTKGLVGWVRVALHACLILMAGTKRNNT